MSKKIIFDGPNFPRFSEEGDYSTELETNRVDRFYLEDNELKDKYLGKTDEEISEIELAVHEAMLAEQAAAESAALARDSG